VGAPPRFAQSLQCSFGLKHRILDLRHARGGRSRCLTQDVPQGSVFNNAVFPTPASPRTTSTPLRAPPTTHQTRRTRDAARAAPSEAQLAACPVHEERAFSQEASLVVESVCELRIAAGEAVEPVFDLVIDASSAPLRVDVQRRLPVGVAGLCLHEDEVSSGLEGERDEGPTESVRRDSRGQGGLPLDGSQGRGCVGDRVQEGGPIRVQTGAPIAASPRCSQRSPADAGTGAGAPPKACGGGSASATNCLTRVARRAVARLVPRFRVPARSRSVGPVAMAWGLGAPLTALCAANRVVQASSWGSFKQQPGAPDSGRR
jgi:hypothetical protein